MSVSIHQSSLATSNNQSALAPALALGTVGVVALIAVLLQHSVRSANVTTAAKVIDYVSLNFWDFFKDYQGDVNCSQLTFKIKGNL